MRGSPRDPPRPPRARSRTGSRRRSLAVPVVDRRRPRQVQPVVAGHPRPRPDLVAVRVHRNRGRPVRRQDQEAPRAANGVGALLTRREAHDVSAPQLPFALGSPHDRRPLDHEQPLLDAVVVVVRERLLGRRQLIDGAADQLRPEAVADALPAGALPRAVALVRHLVAQEIERRHAFQYRAIPRRRYAASASPACAAPSSIAPATTPYASAQASLYSSRHALPATCAIVAISTSPTIGYASGVAP